HLTKMENQEAWVLDSNPEVQKELTEWADGLESETEFDELRKYDEELLIILSFIRVKKSMSLLQGLEKKIPGIPIELMYVNDRNNHPEKFKKKIQKASLIYRNRLIALHRADLIRRVFSKERCEKVMYALKEVG
ncbi:MAG: hypothetical protein KZQ69_15165, partial [gamma proteobacterium symbiont of Bathyaustriella thionipta]|nr:hypothetical protein [gamma proteobacterium symbiont of Bathyaustriella thionipta]